MSAVRGLKLEPQISISDMRQRRDVAHLRGACAPEPAARHSVEIAWARRKSTFARCHHKLAEGRPYADQEFQGQYVIELQELANMESQLDEALKRMADAATHPALKKELMRHREETKEQSKRLQSILQNHGAKLRAHTDQAMEALVNETKKMLSLLEGDLRDAGLIASAQKLEHYEIAAYGTAAALAGQLGLRDDQRLLHDSLEEERKADAALTKLAKSEVNQNALAA
jgi:ferritin-like metal-binding protein YciE